jgi:hypothetical protein
MFQSVIDDASVVPGFSKDDLVSTFESIQGLVSRGIPGGGLIPVLICTAAWAVWSHIRRTRRHAYPGPPRVPFLGNTWQVLCSPVAPFMLFEEWSRKYGKH